MKPITKNGYFARFMNIHVKGSTFYFERPNDERNCIIRVYDRCVAFTADAGGDDGLVAWAAARLG